MSSLIEICLSVCVFYGNCLYSNAETVELTSRDWKQMVEIRLMKLENELALQSKENKRIKAENVFLRSQFQESKDRENELLKIVHEMKRNIEELIKSQNHPDKKHKKYPQMETSAPSISHIDVEPVKRIVPPTSSMNTDPIAFYSFISADTTTKLQLHQILIYDTVKINLGQGYHQDDGIFIAPRSGIYGFAWTLAVSSSGWNEVIGGENLKKQAWFHGYIPREEAEQLMKRNGDFLVRETMNTTDQDRYVISSFRNGPVHFKVFPGTIVTRVGRRATLIDLVNHLVTSGEPLSNSNPSILKFPVDRNQHQLDFDQIKLGPKIDNMQRGHGLYNGTFVNKAVLVSSDEDKETRLFKNVNLLRFFDHPNIVRLEGYSALWKPVLLLMENMSGGPLLTYLRGNGTSLTTRKRTEMCRDVARGMAYLHKDKFIHRDVAARNCLVSDGGVVKIYDFWMTEKGEAYQIQDKIGRQIPIKWTAPEALLSGSYTLSSDVWSFGILMWETFSSGLLPYPGLSNKETTEQVPKGYRMKSPNDTPKSCYSLMLKCWEENPTKRGNFEEIVKKLQTIVQKTK